MPVCHDCGKTVPWDKTDGKYHIATHDCKLAPKKPHKDLDKVVGVCFNGYNLKEGLLEHVLGKDTHKNISMGG